MSNKQTKRQLKIDIEALMDAWQMGIDAIWNYLDLETGETIPVDEEARRLVKKVTRTIGTDGTQEQTLSLLTEMNIPDWQQQAVLEALQIKAGSRTRYLRIPATSHDGYQD